MNLAQKENAAPDGPRSGAGDVVYPCPDSSAGTVSEYLKGAALARPLGITVFPDTTGSTQRPMRKSLADVAAAIPSRTATRKDGLPLIKLGRFGTAKSRKGSLRHNANLQAIDGIEGDHDAGTMSVEQARECLEVAGLAGLIYTTPSHRPGKPRWRVLCPLSRSHVPADREALCARLNGALEGALQAESFALSQTYFYGRVEGAAVPDVVLVDGRELDLADELNAGALAKDGKPYRAGRPQPVAEPPEDDEDLPHVPDWERLESALPHIPADDREIWLDVGRALHHETRGSERGLELWSEWSATSGKFQAGEPERKWGEMGKPRAGALRTVGTIYHLAAENGWKESYPNPDIARLNKRHALVMVQGRALIATERSDGGTDFGTERDLHALYANDRVPVNEKRDEPVSARWMRHADRRTYSDGVEFAPGGAPHTGNP